MLKLSILIPVYNGENCIGRCLQSIKNQNLNEDEFEILIMNDGSTDNSIYVINEEKKYFKNISVFTHPNCGSDISRNRLIAKAKGQYIYFLDADDYLVNNSLPRILKIGVENNLDLVAFQSEKTSSSSNVQSNVNGSQLTDNIFILNGAEFVKKYPKFRQEIWWYLVKKEFLDHFSIRFNEEKHQNNSDFIFTNECFVQADQIVFLEISIHRYFQSVDSVMRSKDSKKNEKVNYNLLKAILSFNELIKKLKSNNSNLSSEIIDYLEKRKGTMTSFFIHRMLKGKTDKEVFKNILVQLKEKNLYPIAKDLGRDSNSIKSRVIEVIIKNEILFYFARLFY